MKRSSSRRGISPEPMDTSVSMPSGPQPLEIVFSFDTTGSMSCYLDELRKNLQDTIQRLFKDIPFLKIAVFAHGDYCDRSNYITKYIDFTNDVKELCKFVDKAGPTSGGDGPECYELVLHEVRTLLSWKPGTQRSLVMIGDDEPHPITYPDNVKKIDWKQEVKALHDDMGVTIYSVQASSDTQAKKKFWEPMAKRAGGRLITLEQLPTVVDMMMAICYREHGAEFLSTYEAEVRAREGTAMRTELDRMFDALRDDDDDGVTSVPPLLEKTSSLKKVVTKKPSVKVIKKTIIATKPLAKAAGKKPTASASLKARISPKALPISSKKAQIKNKMKRSKTKKLLKIAKHQHREKIPESRFPLKNLIWSNWQLLIALKVPVGQNKGNWGEALSGLSGVRRLNMFNGNTRIPAVYEVAVQPQPGCRKYVMGCRASQGFSGHNWDSYFCRTNLFEKQIQHAVEKGCRVFVRRIVVQKSMSVEGKAYKNATDLCSGMRKMFDYPWHLTRKGKWMYTRAVTWRGVQISL